MLEASRSCRFKSFLVLFKFSTKSAMRCQYVQEVTALKLLPHTTEQSLQEQAGDEHCAALTGTRGPAKKTGKCTQSEPFAEGPSQFFQMIMIL